MKCEQNQEEYEEKLNIETVGKRDTKSRGKRGEEEIRRRDGMVSE